MRFGWADHSRQLLVSGCVALLLLDQLPVEHRSALVRHSVIPLPACLPGRTCSDAAGDVLVWDLSARRPCVTLSGAHPGGTIEATIVAGSAQGTSWLYTYAPASFVQTSDFDPLHLCHRLAGLSLRRQGRDNSVCVWNLTELLTPASASRPQPTPTVALPDSDHSFCKMAIGVPTTHDSYRSSPAEEVQPEPELEPQTAATRPVEREPRLVGLASTTDSNLSIWDTYAIRSPLVSRFLLAATGLSTPVSGHPQFLSLMYSRTRIAPVVCAAAVLLRKLRSKPKRQPRQSQPELLSDRGSVCVCISVQFFRLKVLVPMKRREAAAC